MEKLGNFVFVGRGVKLSRRNKRWVCQLEELARTYKTLDKDDKRSFLEDKVLRRVYNEGSQFEYWAPGEKNPRILQNDDNILDKLVVAIANMTRHKKSTKPKKACSAMRTVTPEMVMAPAQTQNGMPNESIDANSSGAIPNFSDEFIEAFLAGSRDL